MQLKKITAAVLAAAFTLAGPGQSMAHAAAIVAVQAPAGSAVTPVPVLPVLGNNGIQTLPALQEQSLTNLLPELKTTAFPSNASAVSPHKALAVVTSVVPGIQARTLNTSSKSLQKAAKVTATLLTNPSMQAIQKGNDKDNGQSHAGALSTIFENSQNTGVSADAVAVDGLGGGPLVTLQKAGNAQHSSKFDMGALSSKDASGSFLAEMGIGALLMLVIGAVLVPSVRADLKKFGQTLQYWFHKAVRKTDTPEGVVDRILQTLKDSEPVYKKAVMETAMRAKKLENALVNLKTLRSELVKDELALRMANQQVLADAKLQAIGNVDVVIATTEAELANAKAQLKQLQDDRLRLVSENKIAAQEALSKLDQSKALEFEKRFETLKQQVSAPDIKDDSDRLDELILGQQADVATEKIANQANQQAKDAAGSLFLEIGIGAALVAILGALLSPSVRTDLKNLGHTIKFWLTKLIHFRDTPEKVADRILKELEKSAPKHNEAVSKAAQVVALQSQALKDQEKALAELKAQIEQLAGVAGDKAVLKLIQKQKNLETVIETDKATLQKAKAAYEGILDQRQRLIDEKELIVKGVSSKLNAVDMERITQAFQQLRQESAGKSIQEDLGRLDNLGGKEAEKTAAEQAAADSDPNVITREARENLDDLENAKILDQLKKAKEQKDESGSSLESASERLAVLLGNLKARLASLKAALSSLLATARGELPSAQEASDAAQKTLSTAADKTGRLARILRVLLHRGAKKTETPESIAWNILRELKTDGVPYDETAKEALKKVSSLQIQWVGATGYTALRAKLVIELAASLSILRDILKARLDRVLEKEKRFTLIQDKLGAIESLNVRAALDRAKAGIQKAIDDVTAMMAGTSTPSHAVRKDASGSFLAEMGIGALLMLVIGAVLVPSVRADLKKFGQTLQYWFHKAVRKTDTPEGVVDRILQALKDSEPGYKKAVMETAMRAKKLENAIAEKKAALVELERDELALRTANVPALASNKALEVSNARQDILNTQTELLSAQAQLEKLKADRLRLVSENKITAQEALSKLDQSKALEFEKRFETLKQQVSAPDIKDDSARLDELILGQQADAAAEKIANKANQQAKDAAGSILLEQPLVLASVERLATLATGAFAGLTLALVVGGTGFLFFDASLPLWAAAISVALGALTGLFVPEIRRSPLALSVAERLIPATVGAFAGFTLALIAGAGLLFLGASLPLWAAAIPISLGAVAGFFTLGSGSALPSKPAAKDASGSLFLEIGIGAALVAILGALLSPSVRTDLKNLGHTIKFWLTKLIHFRDTPEKIADRILKELEKSAPKHNEAVSKAAQVVQLQSQALKDQEKELAELKAQIEQLAGVSSDKAVLKLIQKQKNLETVIETDKATLQKAKAAYEGILDQRRRLIDEKELIVKGVSSKLNAVDMERITQAFQQLRQESAGKSVQDDLDRLGTLGGKEAEKTAAQQAAADSDPEVVTREARESLEDQENAKILDQLKKAKEQKDASGSSLESASERLSALLASMKARLASLKAALSSLLATARGELPSAQEASDAAQKTLSTAADKTGRLARILRVLLHRGAKKSETPESIAFNILQELKTDGLPYDAQAKEALKRVTLLEIQLEAAEQNPGLRVKLIDDRAAALASLQDILNQRLGRILEKEKRFILIQDKLGAMESQKVRQTLDAAKAGIQKEIDGVASQRSKNIDILTPETANLVHVLN